MLHCETVTIGRSQDRMPFAYHPFVTSIPELHITQAVARAKPSCVHDARLFNKQIITVWIDSKEMISHTIAKPT